MQTIHGTELAHGSFIVILKKGEKEKIVTHDSFFSSLIFTEFMVLSTSHLYVLHFVLRQGKKKK